MIGAVAMVVAVQTNPIWTLALVGVGDAALETTWVLGDARLQELVPAATRATVTSVRSFNSGITGALAFGIVSLMTDGDDPTPGLLVAIAILFAIGATHRQVAPRPLNNLTDYCPTRVCV